MKHITIEANINEKESGKALYKLLELISYYTLSEVLREDSGKNFECQMSDTDNPDDIVYQIKVEEGEHRITSFKTMADVIDEAIEKGEEIKWTQKEVPELSEPEPEYEHRDKEKY